jgi:hypothetical protein
MPFFVVTMTQTIEHEYGVEAFDEAEAITLAYEEDERKGNDHWYRGGYEGDVTTTVHEMSPEEIENNNDADRFLSLIRNGNYSREEYDKFMAKFVGRLARHLNIKKKGEDPTT